MNGRIQAPGYARIEDVEIISSTKEHPVFGEHHDLLHEFPEYKERIDALKAQDADFARLCQEFDAIDEELLRIQQQLETPSDVYVENLKKKRVHLKDQLYARLTA